MKRYQLVTKLNKKKNLCSPRIVGAVFPNYNKINSFHINNIQVAGNKKNNIFKLNDSTTNRLFHTDLINLSSSETTQESSDIKKEQLLTNEELFITNCFALESPESIKTLKLVIRKSISTKNIKLLSTIYSLCILKSPLKPTSKNNFTYNVNPAKLEALIYFMKNEKIVDEVKDYLQNHSIFETCLNFFTPMIRNFGRHARIYDIERPFISIYEVHDSLNKILKGKIEEENVEQKSRKRSGRYLGSTQLNVLSELMSKLKTKKEVSLLLKILIKEESIYTPHQFSKIFIQSFIESKSPSTKSFKPNEVKKLEKILLEKVKELGFIEFIKVCLKLTRFDLYKLLELKDSTLDIKEEEEGREEDDIDEMNNEDEEELNKIVLGGEEEYSQFHKEEELMNALGMDLNNESKNKTITERKKKSNSATAIKEEKQTRRVRKRKEEEEEIEKGGVEEKETKPIFDDSLFLGKGFSPMLSLPLANISDKVISTLKNTLKQDHLYLDYKYDGQRILLHYINGKTLKCYSRSGKEINFLEEYGDSYKQELLKTLQKLNINNFIIDGEYIIKDIKTKNILNFLTFSRRRNLTEDTIPSIKVFDILYLNNKSYLNESLKERKLYLDQFINQLNLSFIESSKSKVLNLNTSNNNDELRNDIISFFRESIKDGCEGLIIKPYTNEASYYKIAKRIHWYKFKKEYVRGEDPNNNNKELFDTLDFIPIAGKFGKGVRSEGIGSFLLGTIDSNNNEKKKILSVCSVGTGFKEETISTLSKKLLETVAIPKEEIPTSKELEEKYGISVSEKQFKQFNVWFKPQYIWEIKGSEINKTSMNVKVSTSSSGYSVRFPIFCREREDKGIDQATSVEQLKEMKKALEDSGCIGIEEESTTMITNETITEPVISAEKERILKEENVKEEEAPKVEVKEEKINKNEEKEADEEEEDEWLANWNKRLSNK
ncbi:hypothetical protein ABK040_007071 [Willaertia magna]